MELFYFYIEHRLNYLIPNLYGGNIKPLQFNTLNIVSFANLILIMGQVSLS